MTALASSPTLIAVAAATLLYGIYKLIIYPAFLSPLAKIPNAHFTAPISPAWIIWNRFWMRNNRTVDEAHKRLGPVVRLGPNEVSVNCIDGGVRTVYSGGFEKHQWYPRAFGAFGTTSMFSMVKSKTHSQRKRMISNIYSKSFLQGSDHMAAISKTVIFKRLLPILYDASQTGKDIEMYLLNNCTTFEFVNGYIFGLDSFKSFLLDTEAGKAWFHEYQCRKPFEFYRQEIPRLTTLLRTLRVPIIPKYVDRANKIMEDWCLETCDNADKKFASTEPGVEPVVYKQLKKQMLKQQGLKDETEAPKHVREYMYYQIACEVQDHFTAGHETSAVAMTYVFWELSRNKQLQEELREELKALSPGLQFPIPNGMDEPELPSAKSVDALPLLNAIIYEVLRMHAPIPGIQPRITPQTPTTLGTYGNIPPDVRVNAQAYSLHKNPDVFPNPEVFDPKRWLKPEGSPELEMMRRWFWAFGSGGRMCIGSNLALQEMKLLTASIWTNFHTEIVDDEDIEEIDAYTVHPKGSKLVLKFHHV
ncbi:Cytochrome P450 [Ascosphaera apis ARSEF 7405]|uniref:Cytochrome P450 n=1 Tax=Ascosphaera apis ARSEF 7405 TaxID=392613 RepID=A0A168DLF6_9EURO|nr:Cytochrome P450 [Ascosphaera apis ARSEF 7405]